ncbi:general substrate transporter [Aspergillus pseudoustus]|uniref:General substrate transporter n=1 Tax=Aspergillus pseudoustus TaxID=1810923 RepID=A0ABR4JPN2_9EURO
MPVDPKVTEEERVETLAASTEKQESVVDLVRELEDARPKAWSYSLFRLIAVLLPGYFAIILQGFDGSLMGAINAMPQYQQFFGLRAAGSSTGLVFVIFNIGAVAALPIVGPISDTWGRRWALFAGGIFVIIGTCIQAPAINRGMFLGGRFLVGFGQGFLNVSGITYVTEMAHPYWRGPICSFLETNYFAGSIIASWVTYGTAYMAGTISFRLPVWLQLISAGYIVVTVFFSPESPRWLVAHNRHEEAQAILAKYHGEGIPTNPFVRLQMAEMRAQISPNSLDAKWWDYRALFMTRPARRRLFTVLAFAWFGQYSGNALVSYYFPVIVAQAGIHNAHTQLLLNALNPVFSWIAAMTGAMFSDTLGRRPLLLAGFSGCAMCLAVVTGLTKASNDGSQASGYAGIAFIYLFSIVFSFCITPLQTFYISECLDLETRAKGGAAAQVVASIAGIVGQYTTGVAIADLGYYYYLVFVFWDCIEAAVVYFFFPETKGRTLEEINDIFQDPQPVKKSLQLHSSVETVQTVLGSGH